MDLKELRKILHENAEKSGCEVKTKQILKDLNFTVESGEFLSILGPSGCGKTTLLRILIGLEKSDSGSILKDNSDISNLHPSKRGMGIVFQNYALFENMTVIQNVEYALLHNKDFVEKYSKQQIREKVEKTIQKTWDDFRQQLANKGFIYSDIDIALESTF